MLTFVGPALYSRNKRAGKVTEGRRGQEEIHRVQINPISVCRSACALRVQGHLVARACDLFSRGSQGLVTRMTQGVTKELFE